MAAAALNYTTDFEANLSAQVAADLLATSFGFTNSGVYGSSNPEYFATTIRPDGLEIALTRAPDAAMTARCRDTAAPVPVSFRIVAYGFNELDAARMSVAAQSDAITALGIEQPRSCRLDNETNLVVLATRTPFPDDAPANLRDLVGPLVTLVYDPNRPWPTLL